MVAASGYTNDLSKLSEEKLTCRQSLRVYGYIVMFPSCSLQSVSDHVWWFTPESRRDRPSLAVVVGAKETLLLDVGASPKHLDEFRSALSSSGVPLPSRAVLTHWHWDHVFGIGAFEGPVIAHRETAAMLEKMAIYDYSDAGLPALAEMGHASLSSCEHMRLELTDAERRELILRSPEVVINDHMQIDLGGVNCEIRHVGGDHAPDSLVIHVQEDQLLFMGDCLCDAREDQKRYLSRQKLLPLIDRLEAFEAEIHLEGHGFAPIKRDELMSWIGLMRDAYSTLDRLSVNSVELVKEELCQRHDTALVNDFLPPIIAGYEFS